MTCYFDFDFIIVSYIYAAIAYVLWLFAEYIYHFPPSFTSPCTGNDFYSQVKELMEDVDNQDIRQKIINSTEKLKIIYPHVSHKALIRASEFLSMGFDACGILEQLGKPSPKELDLTPDDLDDDFCRDLVVSYFQYCS